MAEFYIVLRDTDTFESLHLTQDQANDVATADDDLTARRGLIEVPDAISLGWKLSGGALVDPRSVLGDAAQAAILKHEITSLVLAFDDALQMHWAGHESVTNERPTNVLSDDDKTLRFDNTHVWGRSWLGIGWRECDRLEQDHADKLSLADVRKVVAAVRGEIQSSAHVRFWFGHHYSAEMWGRELFSSGGNHPLRVTDADNEPVLFLDPVIALDDAAWLDLITTQYENAFKEAIRHGA